ncbi:TssN family type VI secretion system protein, partial [Flavobacterium hercynium]
SYKKVFYPYILSFVLFYALLVFFGHNKLFSEVSDEFLFYEVVSFLMGILHCWLYQKGFKQFGSTKIGIEVLFGTLVILYSSVPFIIIYTTLNGIFFTYLMCIHFVLFLCPTGINISFNLMMLIPPPEYATWTPKAKYDDVTDEEMKDVMLITFVIKRGYYDQEPISMRAIAPVRVEFGRLFILTLQGYNEHNPENEIELIQPEGQDYNWVFFIENKWHQKQGITPNEHVGANPITENSVVICERRRKRSVKEVQKIIKSDDIIYDARMMNETAKKVQIEGIENSKSVKKIE